MNSKAVGRWRQAFSRVELLTVTVVLLLLAGLLCMYLTKGRRSSSRFACAFNLRQIGLAEFVFQNEHNGFPPWMLSKSRGGTLDYSDLGDQTFRHFQVQSNYITAWMLLICPQDTRRAAINFESMVNTNVSYFVCLESKHDLPKSVMYGDRNITPQSSVVLQTTQPASLGWVKSVGLHGDKGHLVFGDGHVEEINSPELARAIQETGIVTNHFAIP